VFQRDERELDPVPDEMKPKVRPSAPETPPPVPTPRKAKNAQVTRLCHAPAQIILILFIGASCERATEGRATKAEGRKTVKDKPVEMGCMAELVMEHHLSVVFYAWWEGISQLGCNKVPKFVDELSNEKSCQ
jgi:hypothetical protein